MLKVAVQAGHMSTLMQFFSAFPVLRLLCQKVIPLFDNDPMCSQYFFLVYCHVLRPDLQKACSDVGTHSRKYIHIYTVRCLLVGRVFEKPNVENIVSLLGWYNEVNVITRSSSLVQ